MSQAIARSRVLNYLTKVKWHGIHPVQEFKKNSLEFLRTYINPRIPLSSSETKHHRLHQIDQLPKFPKKFRQTLTNPPTTQTTTKMKFTISTLFLTLLTVSARPTALQAEQHSSMSGTPCSLVNCKSACHLGSETCHALCQGDKDVSFLNQLSFFQQKRYDEEQH